MQEKRKARTVQPRETEVNLKVQRINDLINLVDKAYQIQSFRLAS